MPIFPLAMAGGFDTDSGPSASFAQDPQGYVVVPWLIDADNAVFELDGWPRKMPGAARVNTTPTGATDAVMGGVDYWRQGTSGAPAQMRVIYAGSVIYKDDADGVWDSLSTGNEAGEMPAFAIMNDNLILATTSNTDVPRTYDQSSITNLGGTPPNFAFHVEHKDRMWAAGVIANPSRLYYSALGNPADWTGAGSGSIDFFSDDGDQLTGLASHHDELVVFKGPNHGSLYRLIGSSPTGAEAFQVLPFVTGVGCTSHQSIIRAGKDLVWWDQNGIHSLIATANFGDYDQAFLSRAFARYYRESLNHTRLDFVTGVNWTNAGLALWTVSRSGATTNNLILGLDYRFRPARAFLWPAYAAASLFIVRDGTAGRIPWAGTYTGLVLRTNQTSRNLDGTAYPYRVTCPGLTFGADAFYDKVAGRGRVGFAPKGDTTFSVRWTRDANTQQSASVSQGGGATLGDSADPFTLDTDTLGGNTFASAFFDMEGSFKELSLQLLQDDLDVDCEPHSLAVEVDPAGLGAVGTLG